MSGRIFSLLFPFKIRFNLSGCIPLTLLALFEPSTGTKSLLALGCIGAGSRLGGCWRACDLGFPFVACFVMRPAPHCPHLTRLSRVFQTARRNVV
ncbi:hypothetical protein FN846DRAFT_981469 [Sphaerosporella brunnea]|uniref:Uncharacterized protein n=1 Tax=Sphaerosporella brunnea TaxID=1250544 RepID=A0A5J5ECA1_9PEZI|nr:hypothetical protein FN846DRAFT_981469 [Sphaerosporella brunnea]